MYSENDYKRQLDIDKQENYRSHFRIDYSRLLHSASFRRLQGKKQLFAGFESDFFRNRLTHSLEVSQIAKAIALKFNKENTITQKLQIDVDLIEFAGLAHDLGHPPFGHNGEEALDELMRDHGGFEGNAQTFRVLTKIEKKEKIDWENFPINNTDDRLGLNLTYRSLASILKYDMPIKNGKLRKEVQKGYYDFDKKIVNEIKKFVTKSKDKRNFKTIECSIMDIADDIAYSTYDLEDSLKANFISPLDFLNPNEKILTQINMNLKKKYKNEKKDHPCLRMTNENIQARLYEIFNDLFSDSFDRTIDNISEETKDNEFLKSLLFASSYYNYSKQLCQDGYERTFFSSSLIKKFMSGVSFVSNASHPELSKAILEQKTLQLVEVLKTFNYINIIKSPMLKVSEHRGKEIIKKIFKAIEENSDLMPDDYQQIYNNSKTKSNKKRTICDFIAGMTDRYAVEFYSRLFSERPESIFKPF